MNARERLRAYLQQRRELGESEMVLDALEVDDVMRMLGALQAGGARPAQAAPAGTSPASDAPRTPARAPLVPEIAERVVFKAAESPAPPPSDDWREVMSALKGATPGASAAKPPVPVVPPPDALSTAQSPSTRSPTLRVEGIVVPLGLRVERPSQIGSAPSVEWRTIDDVTAAIAACTGCSLVQSATRPVPGVGDSSADVMVVGEAPGEKEDLTGEPFVGPAGELLTKILGAIQLSRETVFICNVLKHRPPGNRNPMPDEVRACAPFLQRQIDLVQPKMILAFGTFAAQSLLGTKLAIGKLRQQLHWYQGIPLVATYHPAALLRNDAWKRPTWEDVKLARRVLDATIRT
jgi:DNA polymerase